MSSESWSCVDVEWAQGIQAAMHCGTCIVCMLACTYIVHVVMHICVRWPENRMLVGGWAR